MQLQAVKSQPPLRTDAESQLIAHFAALKAAGAADMPTRIAAFSQFEKAGLPNRRIEAWHYTDLRRLMAEALNPVERPSEATLKAALLSKGTDAAIKLIDGVLAGGINLPAGVSVSAAPLSEAPLANSDVMVSLNGAFAAQSVEIHVAAGAQIADPIHLLLKSPRKAAVSTRIIIRVGAGAKVSFFEECRAESGQHNNLLHFDIGDGAEVEHVALVANASQQISTLTANIGADVSFNTFALVASGGLNRRQTFARFNGENSKAGFRGVVLLKGQQHADTTLEVTHVAPHCESRELYRHILDGHSKGVFQGRIVVEAQAQKTDGVMKSNTLALSDHASMSNKPELEIFADDVVCGHGATVKQLDDNELFYLQARGLPKPEAESLLIEAFAVDVLDYITDENLRDKFNSKIHAWLLDRNQG